MDRHEEFHPFLQDQIYDIVDNSCEYLIYIYIYIYIYICFTMISPEYCHLEDSHMNI